MTEGRVKKKEEKMTKGKGMTCGECIHYRVGGMCAVKKVEVKTNDNCCPKFKEKPKRER